MSTRNINENNNNIHDKRGGNVNMIKSQDSNFFENKSILARNKCKRGSNFLIKKDKSLENNKTNINSTNYQHKISDTEYITKKKPETEVNTKNNSVIKKEKNLINSSEKKMGVIRYNTFNNGNNYNTIINNKTYKNQPKNSVPFLTLKNYSTEKSLLNSQQNINMQNQN